mmetsp:Transcript_8270/g.4420  ORF Transcript_8270/g.4420 Transcript_8270/m.4420 type:complete len:95 (+) Transcript_8270:160-444(+)
MPLLAKEIIESPSGDTIKLGEDLVEYSTEFYFYVTTKFPKPHYAPEICVRVTLLNFTTTEEGLEEQLLTFTVANENPEVDILHKKCIELMADLN